MTSMISVNNVLPNRQYCKQFLPELGITASRHKRLNGPNDENRTYVKLEIIFKRFFSLILSLFQII